MYYLWSENKAADQLRSYYEADLRLLFSHSAYRAFSDLFGKFLVPMKLGKKCVILGKNMLILGKNSAIFNKIGKVYLLNLDFSAIWECSRSIWNFFSQFGKNLVPETGPSFVYRKSPGIVGFLMMWLIYRIIILRFVSLKFQIFSSMCRFAADLSDVTAHIIIMAYIFPVDVFWKVDKTKLSNDQRFCF